MRLQENHPPAVATDDGLLPAPLLVGNANPTDPSTESYLETYRPTTETEASPSKSVSRSHHHRKTHGGEDDSNQIGANIYRFYFKCLGKLWCSRLALVVSLVASATLLGWATRYSLRAKEEQLGTSQFVSIAERALVGAQQTLSRRRSGTAALATLHAGLFPDASAWPFVSVPRYNEIARDMSLTSSGFLKGHTPIERVGEGGLETEQMLVEDTGHALGVVHFLTPDQIEEFNEFQREYLDTYFPPARGVFQMPPRTLPNGTTVRLPPSRFNISAPISQAYERTDKLGYTMLDTLSSGMFRPSVEHHLEVAEENAAANTTNVCGIYSQLAPAPKNLISGPVSHYSHPIYPFGSPSTLVGLAVSPVEWELVLQDVFTSKVSGLVCILNSGHGISHKFLVVDGKPMYAGQGPSATLALDNEKQSNPNHHKGLSITLTEHHGLCPGRSVEYHLTLIPTNEFYKSLSTANPTIAWIGAVLVIAFTSLLFSIYDFFVRKDMKDKHTTIQANRSFLRFVSHEVRTPLNTVSMGLKVMCDDVRELVAMESNRSEKLASSSQQTASVVDGDEDEAVLVPRNKIARLVTLAGEISVSAESAVEILSDVLLYDKIDHGHVRLELTLFPIRELLAGVMTEFQLSAQGKNISLTLECSSTADYGKTVPLQRVLVAADKVRLAQVLRNLLSNAIKFTQDGGSIQARLQLIRENSNDSGEDMEQSRNNQDVHDQDGCTLQRSCQPVGYIKLSLTDNGIGMTQNQVQRVFRQGVQFSANALQNGKGSRLGLYIAKGIVEQHGGTLSASSDGLGRGSTITFVLPAYDTAQCHEPSTTESDANQNAILGPLTREEDEAANVDASGESSARVVGPLIASKYRALVVDDAPMNRKLLARLLETRGWTCDCAADGKIALDMETAARKQNAPYDCILLDYEMPVMNGPDTAKQLRAVGCKSCVVGVTGNVLPDDVSYFVSCGVASVFFKPVDLEAFDSFLRENGVLRSREDPFDESIV